METKSLRVEPDNRSQSRSNVFLAATLVAGAVSLQVRVRNLSSRGALLDGGSFPPAGARVRLIRGELNADGRIAWHAPGHAGIRFANEIDVEEWVKRVGHPGQQRVDEAIASLRYEQGTPVDPRASKGMTLEGIGKELDGICERLANLPSMSVELGEELVRLDALARTLQQFAGHP